MATSFLLYENLLSESTQVSAIVGSGGALGATAAQISSILVRSNGGLATPYTSEPEIVTPQPKVRRPRTWPCAWCGYPELRILSAIAVP